MGLVAPWHVESSTRDQARVPCIGKWILNHWTNKKSCMICFMYPGIYFIIPLLLGYFFVVQSLSSIWLCDPMDCSTPGFPVLHHLLWSNSCPLSWWCHPSISSSFFPVSSCLQSFLASGSFPLRCIRWPKYWSFSLSISPSNEFSGLISFRMDWFDLLAVQGTFKSFSSTTVWKHQFLGAY